MNETPILKMDEEPNQQTNIEFEISIKGIPVSKGSNLDELLTDAKKKYPDKAIGIRKRHI